VHANASSGAQIHAQNCESCAEKRIRRESVGAVLDTRHLPASDLELVSAPMDLTYVVFAVLTKEKWHERKD